MNKLNWVEIPAIDHDRAIRFYSTILSTTIEKGETLGIPYSFLPDGMGAIASADHVKPSVEGVTVYIHIGDEMDSALEKGRSCGRNCYRTKISTWGGTLFCGDS